MQIKYINTGSSPNKGDGDTLRTAFNKINANFAFFTAFNIILNFNEETDITHYTEPNLSFDGAIAPMEDKMDKILENHRRYLAALSSVHESPAIISNAFTLELIDLFFKFRWQALMV